ncbi:hemerythrin domain-containing protein [Bacillus piscicola]|uniref:hemerythrin domain-containing protein n=1 Tax=Bacillus piscicola TaxID=1632684 RepID=UPI001F092B46|nr:hemerythrin domain-containing protein [Bacillus piscicola]
MEKKQKGITRHESLYPLSHHHHRALFLALKLKRAGTEKSRFSIEQIAEDLKDFWEPGGDQHFREEEEILLPAFSEFATIERPEIIDMLLEHVTIRAAIQGLLYAFDQENFTDWSDLLPKMHRLGHLLEEHVRKEERIVFPLIEASIPEEKLRKLEQLFHK